MTDDEILKKAEAIKRKRTFNSFLSYSTHFVIWGNKSEKDFYIRKHKPMQFELTEKESKALKEFLGNLSLG